MELFIAWTQNVKQANGSLYFFCPNTMFLIVFQYSLPTFIFVIMDVVAEMVKRIPSAQNTTKMIYS